jgi:hypothetical protein
MVFNVIGLYTDEEHLLLEAPSVSSQDPVVINDRRSLVCGQIIPLQ